MVTGVLACVFFTSKVMEGSGGTDEAVAALLALIVAELLTVAGGAGLCIPATTVDFLAAWEGLGDRLTGLGLRLAAALTGIVAVDCC